MANRIIYLLHIEDQDGATSHYVGICNEGRENVRLIEHLRDKRNAKLHQRLIRRRIVKLQVVDWNATHGLERMFQCASEETLRTQICEACYYDQHEQEHEPERTGTKIPDEDH
jgi:hypothetical protein